MNLEFRKNEKPTLFPVLMFYSFFIFISIVIAHFTYKNLFFIGFERIIRVHHILFGIGSGILVVLLSFLLTYIFHWAQKLEKEFKDYLTPLPLASIFGMALASALGEEFLFRGAIQQASNIYIASFLFGLFHFPFKKEMIPWTVMAIVMGFLLGWLFEYTGNLAAPILCHFTINFINILILNLKK
ncbi:MAG: CPBP family intramembrane metalloprotease [Deltaproteobacteria bacterium]|nr:CPBP family intramembrane metalloprotease [Deltaproteobacteria bacterium]